MLIDEHLEVNPVTLTAVSDVWQGPGWWLAPDGKWYPADGGPEGTASVDTVIPDVAAPDQVETPTVDSLTLDTPVVDIPIAETPIAETPTAETPTAETPAASSGGWQAAEPELDEDEATSEEGWTSGFTGEIPEIDAPEPDRPVGEDPGRPVGEDPVPAASILEAPPSTAASEKPTGRRAPDPIHRDDAWRKPNEDELPLEMASTSRGAPEVVDLAVPKPVGIDGTVDDNNGVSPLFLAIGVTAALLLLAVAINFLFFGDDDDTDVNTDPETSTSAAPTTTAEPTDTSDTSVEADRRPSRAGRPKVLRYRCSTCRPVTASRVKSARARCRSSSRSTASWHTNSRCTVRLWWTGRSRPTTSTPLKRRHKSCAEASLALLIPEDDDRDLMYKWFQPTEQSWNQAGNPRPSDHVPAVR